MDKLVIIDHFLTDNKGHDEQYDFTIAREAIRRGIQAEVWSPQRKGVQPDFVKQCLKTPFWKRTNLLKKIYAALGSIFEWRKLLNDEKLDKNTTVLIQTIKFPILIFLSLGLIGTSVRPRLVIILRRGLGNNIAKVLMQYLCKRKNAILMPDSELITEELLKEGFKDVKTLPIPHLPEREGTKQENEMVIGYFGEARDDKGFDLLPGFVGLTLKRYPGTKIIIQSNLHKGTALMRKTSEELNKLRDLHPGKVEIVDRYISNLEYTDYMRKCSIILIPYRAKFYGKGTSGILAEAIACGKWAIVPAGTWMADQKSRYPKIAVFNDASAESIVDAVKECKGSYPGLEQNIDEWYKFHSAENYINILLAV
jgi:glycosyltransferase involved in cell wall biosynthesis